MCFSAFNIYELVYPVILRGSDPTGSHRHGSCYFIFIINIIIIININILMLLYGIFAKVQTFLFRPFWQRLLGHGPNGKSEHFPNFKVKNSKFKEQKNRNFVAFVMHRFTAKCDFAFQV